MTDLIAREMGFSRLFALVLSVDDPLPSWLDKSIRWIKLYK